MKHLDKVKKLQSGESFDTKEFGNSMIPLIYSGQKHRLEPVTDISTLTKGDIVFCKVNGRFYTHKVYAYNEQKGVKIGNNKGHINGWTKNVYGKVIKVYDK